jgi:hypothetical protein
MSLLQIIAIDSANQDFRLANNLATEYFTEEFINNSLIIQRNCDARCPEFLEIDLSPNINDEDLNSVFHKVCFELQIGGQTILSIPLRFMMKLNQCQICDNKYYIKIPFEMFFDDIKLISLQYHEVRVNLTNIDNNFGTFKLISKGVFYDTPVRRSMALNSHESIIQQLSSIEIESRNERNEFGIYTNFEGINKGFFIESENVDEINELKIRFNSQERVNYNRFLVRTKCIKINQSLLYFPFNFDKSYRDRTHESFEGSPNLSRLDICLLNIKFDNQQSKICIYGLNANILKIQSGMAGLSFIYENSNIHIYRECDGNGIYQRISFETRGPRGTNFETIGPSGTTGPNQSIVNNINENIVYRPILDNEKLTCCITYEEILVNTRYMRCNVCENNYGEQNIKQWFRQSLYRRTCPMCRADWLDLNIYINGYNEDESLDQATIILDPPTTP